MKNNTKKNVNTNVDAPKKDNKKIVNFFKENPTKFQTKRQASKYLNGYGSVYKTDRNIDMSYSKRLHREPVLTQASNKKKK